jgi:hypothetical protein
MYEENHFGTKYCTYSLYWCCHYHFMSLFVMLLHILNPSNKLRMAVELFEIRRDFLALASP